MLEFAHQYNSVPCHVDEELGANSRNGDITAPGIYTFGLMHGQYSKVCFGGEQILGGTDLDLRFLKPVFAGNILHGYVEVTEKIDRNKYNGMLWTDMYVFNENDELVLTAHANSIVKKRI